MLADCISDMYKESGVCLEVETDKEHDSREAVCDTSARLAALTNINLNSQFPWSCCCYIKWFFFMSVGSKGEKSYNHQRNIQLPPPILTGLRENSSSG